MEPANRNQQRASDGCRYRPNVAGIVRDAGGRILVCERLDHSGAWQFPQGGVHPGEKREQALKRELREELSLRPRDYQIGECRGPYHYLFEAGRKKEGFDGQEQFYFLVSLTSPASTIDVQTEHREFRAVRWIEPREFDLRWLPAMKRPVYRRVLNDFFDCEPVAANLA